MQTRIADICQDFFEAAAEQFPVATASDEFYYFPQVTSSSKDWSIWDNFSAEAIDSFVAKLLGFERELARLETSHHEHLEENLDLEIDFSFLLSAIQILREQLTAVRQWERQPTFHLTIACLGITEALEAKDPSAADLRAETLPAFIEIARKSLRDIPALFRELALNMLMQCQQFFKSLIPRLPSLKKTMPEIEALGDFLQNARTRPDFLLPAKLTERVIRRHLNCRLDFSAIGAVLDREINDMHKQLAQEAHTIADDVPWETHIDNIPLPILPKGGLLALYRKQVQDLAEHCMAMGFVNKDLYRQCPVQVLPVPAFLSATRTASSYSIYPQHPPSGGIFYVINADDPVEARKSYHREYKILSAHETYPGHHFLDCKRLQHKRRLRRSIEKPLFYEGWACFAEMLMQMSGYLNVPHQRLLLARRRLWRAVRGRIDLGLQTGAMTFENAIDELTATGINREDAAAVVRKYPLNPGYQLCYTLGYKNFSDLFQIYGGENIQGFVDCAVSHGEIDFQYLERIFDHKITSNPHEIKQ